MTDRKGTNDAPAVLWRFAPWAIATFLALLAGWMAQRSFMLQTEAELQRHRQALAELALKSAQQQLEAERILNSRQIASLIEQATPTAVAKLQIAVLAASGQSAAGTIAVAVWDPVKQQGVLAFEKPPRLAAGEALELWLVGADGKPVGAGMLNSRSVQSGRLNFGPITTTGEWRAIAISRERADGATAHAQPTEEILRGALR